MTAAEFKNKTIRFWSSGITPILIAAVLQIDRFVLYILFSVYIICGAIYSWYVYRKINHKKNKKERNLPPIT